MVSDRGFMDSLFLLHPEFQGHRAQSLSERTLRQSPDSSSMDTEG